MRTTTSRTGRFAVALVALAIAAPATAAPFVGAPMTSRPPKVGGTHMHWYHWHASSRNLTERKAQFGSTAVIGLASMRDLASLREHYGFSRVRPIPELHAAEVRVDAAELHALLANAPSDSRIRYVSPVGPLRRTESMPDDPFVRDIDAWSNLPYEWQFAASGVDRAFDFSKGSPGIVVGVIDTGVADVPDLAGKVDGLWGFSNEGTPTLEPVTDGTDTFGHGTAVASLIAANVGDGLGMAGFGGATHVLAFRACPDGLCADTSVAIALTKLDSLGVRIVNLSLGAQSPNEPILRDAIRKAGADGVLIVASAGNVNSHVGWPAADLQPSGGTRGFGLAVGATNVDGRRAEFSNFGQHLSLVAPGNSLGLCGGVLVALPSFSRLDEFCYSTFNSAQGAHYGYINGTSFSAPEVAGVAALVWATRPELKNYQVADIIKQSARRDSGTEWTPTMGCGQLDAGAALELATSRSAAAWAEMEQDDGAACSAAGDRPPTWSTELTQTITFDPIARKTLGDSDFLVSATASSGLPVSFTAGGACTVAGITVHLTGAGSCSIVASQDGNATYNPAINVSRSFEIAHVAMRTVLVLPAFGRPGGSVNLPFRVGDGNGDVAVKITVQKNRTALAGLARDFFRVESGHVYTLAWRAPKVKTNAVYRFCVTLSDRAARETLPSCGRIRLR